MTQHSSITNNATTAAALLLGLASMTAHADQPYDSDFDAPDNFDAAVLIAPNLPAQPHAGWYGDFPFVIPDVDFYKFTVVAGQSLVLTCAQSVSGSSTSQYPCIARLFDPSGRSHGWGDSSSGAITTWAVENAAAGDWRFEGSGADLVTLATVRTRQPTYHFDLALSPDPAAGGGTPGTASAASVGEGAGALGGVLSLFLAVAAFARSRRDRLSQDRCSCSSARRENSGSAAAGWGC
jgi:hypothetical protein